jgi:tetratricopeptide (TPR) repeat protein
MFLQQQEDDQAHTRNSGRFAERVLVVGWDGAQWSILRSLLEQGRLPHLQSLLNLGACRELLCPRPMVASSVWTSLATGKRPHEHGILHENSPSPDGTRLQPVTRRARQCPAIWNVLNHAGLRTHVVGWPVTHPAEPLDGVCVSDRFAMPVAKKPLTSLSGRLVSPTAAESVLRGQRVAPAQIEDVTLSQLLPREATSLPEYQTLEAICRAILAETATLFRAFRWCLNKQPWDFAACVFPGIRSCHELANWMQSLSPAAAEFRGHLITGCYEHHDLLFGQLFHQVGEGSHLIVVSLAEHGAAVTAASNETNSTLRMASPACNFGMVAICGPSVRRLAVSTPRSILDVAPTICAMFGVPYGNDLGGRPWLDLFDVDLKPQTVDARELAAAAEPSDGPRESVTPGNDSANDNDHNRGVEHLVELGYVDPHDVATRDMAEQCRRTTDLNRAISMLDAGLLAPAIARLEQLTQEHPDWHQSRAILADAYFRANQRQSARREIDWLMCRGSEQPQLYLLSAAIEFSNRHYDSALDELRCAGRAGVKLPGVRSLEGDIHLRKRDYSAAETAYRSSIETDGPTPHSSDGLAAVQLHFGRYEEAAMNALDALALEMWFGRAHYHLAVALLGVDKPQDALRALETWAAVEPLSPAPFRWMARVCERQLGDPSQAAACRAQGREVVRRRRKSLKTARADDTSAPSFAP